MYNLWCEIDRRVPLMIIVGVLFSFGLHLINSDYYAAILLLTIFLILYFINRILKYLSLKFRGKLIHDIPYEFKQINNKEKILIINFQLPNGNYVRLKKKKLNWNSTNETGKTTVLINLKHPRNYYIYDPYVIGKRAK